MKYWVGGAACTGLDLYFIETHTVETYIPNLCCCTISDSKDLQPLVETAARPCLELSDDRGGACPAGVKVENPLAKEENALNSRHGVTHYERWFQEGRSCS